MHSATLAEASPSAFEPFVSATSTAFSDTRAKDWRGKNAFKSVTAALTLVTALTASIPATLGAVYSGVTSLSDTDGPAMDVAAIMMRRSVMSAQIQKLTDLKAGWSGPRSLGATKLAIERSLAFAGYLSFVGVTAQPKINLSSDGEVNFFWNTKKVILDFGISRRGRVSYFGRLAGGREFFGDSPRGTATLPTELLAALIA